jgi:hypothetical protein
MSNIIRKGFVANYLGSHFLMGIIFMAIFIFSGGGLRAQETEAETEEEEIELISPSMDLQTIQRADGSVVLTAALRARIEGSLRLLWGLKVRFYQETSDGEIELGEAISDQKGVSRVEVNPEKIKTEKSGMLTFIARYGGNKSLEEAEETVSITRAILRAEPLTGDDGYSLNLSLMSGSEEQANPLPEMDLNVYVQRMFTPLKIGETATDEEGAAVIEIPDSFTGDAVGNITLLVRLEDNDDYGMLEASVVQPWGIPVSDQITKMPRSLFSQDPPLWMLITFIVLMVTVWGHYFVIVYELVKLRKDIE